MSNKENIHEYPVEPLLLPFEGRVKVVHQDVTIADSTKSYRILQKGIPPTFYFPPDDVETELLKILPGVSSNCPWKGEASYWNLNLADLEIKDAAWSYEDPLPDYSRIKGYFSFYPSILDECTVNGEQVDRTKMPFSGGWITADIEGV